jgi:hypothetical protein
MVCIPNIKYSFWEREDLLKFLQTDGITFCKYLESLVYCVNSSNRLLNDQLIGCRNIHHFAIRH